MKRFLTVVLYQYVSNVPNRIIFAGQIAVNSAARDVYAIRNIRMRRHVLFIHIYFFLSFSLSETSLLTGRGTTSSSSPPSRVRRTRCVNGARLCRRVYIPVLCVSCTRARKGSPVFCFLSYMAVHTRVPVRISRPRPTGVGEGRFND